MNRNLLIKHASTEVTLKEYEEAKLKLSKEEFKNNYYEGHNSFNKIIKISDADLQNIILDKIYSWVKFFGVLAIIGVVAVIILLFI